MIFHVVNSCLWQRALSRCWPSRASRARKRLQDRTVRIVVGFPAGQAIDEVFARLMAEWLQQRLGQTFIASRTAPAPPPISLPRWWRALRRTATRC